MRNKLFKHLFEVKAVLDFDCDVLYNDYDTVEHAVREDTDKFGNLCDNRFFVVGSFHVDILTCGDSEEESTYVYFYDATDCCNMSDASMDFYSKSAFIIAMQFKDEKKAHAFAVEFIKQVLNQF